MLNRPFVIHSRRPYRSLFLIILTIALISIGVWFWSTQWQASQRDQLLALQSQYQQLLNDNQRLATDNEKLSEQLNNINQMQAIQQATDSQLQNELEALQDKLITLNKELLFYQNITQGNVSTELQIRELHLRPIADNPASYTYRIVLTQGKRVTKATKGDVLITLNLSNDGKANSRLLDEHELKIRHVQVLEGMVQLAENETPDSIRVMLREGKKTLAERSFKWEISPLTGP